MELGPVGPRDRGPTPTGKMVADVARGRARAYLRGAVLNIVAVEDVAAGQLRAHERGRAGQRYLLGGENMAMRDVFAAIAHAAGRTPPRVALPWSGVYAAAREVDAAMRPLGREPSLLVLDEVRLARLPMAFDDSLARLELGHESRPGSEALAAMDATSYVLEAPSEGEDEVTGYSPVIIAEATASLKPLSVSEAVMELDLSGAPCMVFQHGSSGRVNIIYRRADGNVGWIDPPGAKADAKADGKA